MKLTVPIIGSLQADLQAELRDIEDAVASGTREVGRSLRTELRRQVTSAGLGRRLASSWRDKHYPSQKLDAASLVYTKALQIIRASDEGTVVRSRRGRLFRDPVRDAPRKGADGKRISPTRSGRCAGNKNPGRAQDVSAHPNGRFAASFLPCGCELVHGLCASSSDRLP